MKKYFLIVLCIFIILPYFYLFSNAAVGDYVLVTSSLPEPIPQYNSGDYVVYFVAQYNSNNVINTNLYEVTFSLSAGKTVKYLMNNYNQWFLWSDEIVPYTVKIYNAENGYFLESHSGTATTLSGYATPDSSHIYVINPRVAGYWPSHSVYNSTLTAAFDILPANIDRIVNNTTGYYNNFVTWGQNILPPNVYRSFVSEPVCDELNRYFILAGEEDQYLYAVRYYVQELDFIRRTISDNGSGYTDYTVDLKNYIAPFLKLSDSGLSLSLYCDPNFCLLVNAGLQNVNISYDIQIAKYNLEDGQYIESYVFNDLFFDDNEIPLNISLGSADLYDSIQVYGIYYKDTSSSLHYNLLACTWALDPDFIIWRQSVEDYLSRIYEILNQSGEEVTINSDMSAINEAESARDALKVTDANGQTVDAAAQVEVAFSEAAQGFGQLSDSVLGINGLINTLFFRHTIVILPVIVALALGLLVTILGKNKSD